MPLPSFKPMLCTPVDVMPESDDFIAERKADGWRAIGIVENGEPRIETRSGNVITGVPYLTEALRCLPDGTVIDGEIADATAIEGGWNRVQTICSSDAGHVPSDKDPALVFEVFDVLFIAGDDVRKQPLDERKTLLSGLLADCPEGLRVAEAFPATTEVLERVLAEGHEGLVVKRRNSPYVGGRSGAWVKLKPTADESAEAEIIGFTEGRGDFTGMVGAIRFRLPSGVEGQASGFDVAQRKAFTSDPDSFVGTVVEVAHWGVNKTGSLRHPQYRRLRADRSVEEMKADPTPIAAAPVKPKKVRTAKTRDSAPKMRNYAAMKNIPKLLGCLESLETQSGDAYDRCLNGGSGEPDADLAVVRKIVAQKRAEGLIA